MAEILRPQSYATHRIPRRTDLLFGCGRRRYIETLRRELGYVKILGMQEPKLLEHIYILVKMSQSMPTRSYRNVEHGSPTGDPSSTLKQLRVKPETEDIVPAMKLIGAYPNILVLGAPGSGKTTFLKYLALAYSGATTLLCDKPPAPKLPIYIPLREMVEGNLDLHDYAATKLASFGFPDATAFIQRLLSRGDLLLLVDGLDEVGATNMARVVRSLNSLTVNYQGNTIVATCRNAAYTVPIERFVEVEIVDFSEADVKTFVTHWFMGDRAHKGQRLLRELLANPQIADLTSTPLLLSLICILFGYDLRLPRNKVDLYERCVDTLLREWDASRNFVRETKYDALSHERKKSILSGVAARFSQQKRFVFTHRELVDAIGNQIERFDIPRDKASEILKEIESHHGILVKRTESTYTFSHLTFQEYFTAKYICDSRQESRFLAKNVCISDWRETVSLVPAMLPDATKYIAELLDHVAATECNVLDTTFCFLFRLVHDISKMEMTLEKPVRSRMRRFLLEEMLAQEVKVWPADKSTSRRMSITNVMHEKMSRCASASEMLVPIQFLIAQRGKRFKKRKVEIADANGQAMAFRALLGSLLDHSLFYFNPRLAFITRIYRKHTQLETLSVDAAWEQWRRGKIAVASAVFHDIDRRELVLL